MKTEDYIGIGLLGLGVYWLYKKETEQDYGGGIAGIGGTDINDFVDSAVKNSTDNNTPLRESSLIPNTLLTTKEDTTYRITPQDLTASEQRAVKKGNYKITDNNYLLTNPIMVKGYDVYQDIKPTIKAITPSIKNIVPNTLLGIFSPTMIPIVSSLKSGYGYIQNKISGSNNQINSMPTNSQSSQYTKPQQASIMLSNLKGSVSSQVILNSVKSSAVKSSSNLSNAIQNTPTGGTVKVNNVTYTVQRKKSVKK
jgi:hypothetical protein